LGIGKTKKQKRKAARVAIRRILTVFFLGVLIVGSMYVYNYLTTSDRFSIRNVEVSGISRMEAGDLDNFLSDLTGQNILLTPLESYEERLKMHPRIERVSTRRVLPDKVICHIEEREPVALVFTDHFLEVDKHGMIMAEDEYTALLDLPIITGLSKNSVKAGKISSDPYLRDALDALILCKSIGGEFAADISELKVTRNGLSIRSLKADCVLVLGDSDFENRLKKYFLLKDTLAEKDQNTGLIDLRFDDQIVLRGQI
jgi:cell division protein FtsQ